MRLLFTASHIGEGLGGAGWLAARSVLVLPSSVPPLPGSGHATGLGLPLLHLPAARQRVSALCADTGSRRQSEPVHPGEQASVGPPSSQTPVDTFALPGVTRDLCHVQGGCFAFMF